MNIVFTVVAVVVIGLLVRSRLIAALLYLVIGSIVFTFQTLSVLLTWMAGGGGFGGVSEQGAFGPTPTSLPLTFDEAEIWAYGLVNLGIMLVGVALTVVVVTLRNRGRAKHSVAVAG